MCRKRQKEIKWILSCKDTGLLFRTRWIPPGLFCFIQYGLPAEFFYEKGKITL